MQIVVPERTKAHIPDHCEHMKQPTVCLSDFHKGGQHYATLYTDRDGYIYRGSVDKETAIEWISRMRVR